LNYKYVFQSLATSFHHFQVRICFSKFCFFIFIFNTYFQLSFSITQINH